MFLESTFLFQNFEETNNSKLFSKLQSQTTKLNKMDIFNGNRKLEQVAMYGIDWGMFIRHNIEETTIPFMWLFDGEETTVNVLMTDDPFEYGMKLLEKEDRSWQQVVIGVEGFLKNESGEKVDSLIVQAFDVSQEKGVSLGQMFIPKEKTGTFSKVDTPAFLGSVDLPFSTRPRQELGYEGTKPGYTNMIMKDNSAMLMAGHPNPSVAANVFKMFIRSKLNQGNAFNGKFSLRIYVYTPSNEFAKYTILNAINDEREAPASKAWEERTGNKIQINVRHDQTVWQTEYTVEKKVVERNNQEKPTQTKSDQIQSKLSSNDTKSSKGAGSKPWWKFW